MHKESIEDVKQAYALLLKENAKLAEIAAEHSRTIQTLIQENAALQAEREAAHPTAGKWFCEDHPEHEMEHGGCKGAGIPEIARGDALANVLQAQRERLRDAISSAAYAYSRYIVEDTAPRTLETHMLESFDAALKETK